MILFTELSQVFISAVSPSLDGMAENGKTGSGGNRPEYSLNEQSYSVNAVFE